MALCLILIEHKCCVGGNVCANYYEHVCCETLRLFFRLWKSKPLEFMYRNRSVSCVDVNILVCNICLLLYVD
jgi:hypothetical protein